MIPVHKELKVAVERAEQCNWESQGGVFGPRFAAMVPLKSVRGRPNGLYVGERPRRKAASV